MSLPEDERLALVAWLNAQNSAVLDTADETLLVKSLEAAIKDMDSGKGISIGDARKLVSKWAGK